MKKVILKIDGMNCTSCVINIDGQLEDTDGVHEASTSYARQQTIVKYDEEKISSEQLLQIVQEAGYLAKPLE